MFLFPVCNDFWGDFGDDTWFKASLVACGRLARGLSAGELTAWVACGQRGAVLVRRRHGDCDGQGAAVGQ